MSCITPSGASPIHRAGPFPLRMLVVDAQPQVLDLFEAWFQLERWEVVCCSDMLVALDRAGTLRPSVLIVDLHLPGVAWHVLVRTLRERPWARGLRAVGLTTGEALPRAQAVFLPLLDACLRKPLDLIAMTAAGGRA